MTRESRPPSDLIDEELGRAATFLLRGYLRLYVLELLQERPRAGSEIASHLVHTCSWKPSPGSIYPLLRQMEERGLAESRWETQGRPRRVYAVTEQGSRERVQLRAKLEPQLRDTLRMLEAHIDYLFGGPRDEAPPGSTRSAGRLSPDWM